MSSKLSRENAAIKSSVILAPVIAASLLLLPIYVGGLITQNGLSLEQALTIVSLEMWGMAASLVPAIFLMKWMSWRRITFGALLIMIAAFAVPICIALNFNSLAIIRFIGGLGAGTAMAVIMATIGRASEPDKAFSLWILSQVFFKVVGIFIIARLLAKFGMAGFFVPLLILCVLALPLTKYLPGIVDDESIAGNKFQWSIKPILALLGVFIFYIAISAIWANFERIGHWSGFEGTTIANILSLTSLASLAGASAATLMAGRVGRSALLLFGTVIIAGASLALGMFSTLTIYTLIGLAFAFAWFFSVPFLIASVNANDESGRLMIFTNSAIAIGLAVGPAIAAKLIMGTEFGLLTIAGAGAFIAAFVLLAPSNRKIRTIQKI